jgi:iron complex outermembrane receptor protein
VILVSVPFENLSAIDTSGLDVDARIKLPALGGVRTTLGLTASYIDTYKQPLAPEDPPTELAGTYNLPRFRAIASASAEAGPWASTLAVNYIGPFKQSTSAAATAVPEIASWTTLDLQVSYAGLRNTKVTLGAKNLADRMPPIAIAEQPQLYVFQLHNIRGRFFYANVTYKFG